MEIITLQFDSLDLQEEKTSRRFRPFLSCDMRQTLGGQDINSTMKFVWLEHAKDLGDAKIKAATPRKPSEFQTVEDYRKLPEISVGKSYSLDDSLFVTRQAICDQVPLNEAVMFVVRPRSIDGLFFGLAKASEFGTDWLNANKSSRNPDGTYGVRDAQFDAAEKLLKDFEDVNQRIKDFIAEYQKEHGFNPLPKVSDRLEALKRVCARYKAEFYEKHRPLK